jgi:STE24 endopeptidase
MLHPKLFYRLLLVLSLVVLLSPWWYWSSGLGQAGADLSAQVIRLADGTLLSSPKAEAYHQLTLPMRIQQLLIFPLLLLSFQLSGGALALRRWVEGRVAAIPAKLPFTKARQQPDKPDKTHKSLISRLWSVLPWRKLLVICLFVLIFEIALALLYLPFSFYRGFVVGHQFDLSTLTRLGWFNDWAKGTLINLGLGGLSWTGLYWLMGRWPRRWPIPAGALLVVFSAVMVLLAPLVITPLFYTVRPLDDPALQSRILTLAGRANMQVEAVEVIDASAKTTTVNAYFTGFGGAQRIVLYDNLLTGYTADQIEVVLAHEMGHWYYQHVLLAILGAGTAGWLGLFGLRWLLNRTWRWLGLAGPADIAGLPFVLTALAIASMVSLPLENGISRLAERQADQFALATSHKPLAMIELFEQFAKQNLSIVAPPTWEKLLFYTHPPIAERIGKAEAWTRATHLP